MTTIFNNSAEQWATEQGLPELTGKSDKQIAAANTVRKHWITRVQEIITHLSGTDEVIPEQYRDAYLRFLKSKTDAVWWMDTKTVYKAPTMYFTLKMNRDSRFVFELAFAQLEEIK
jgi:hypothetical protein